MRVGGGYLKNNTPEFSGPFAPMCEMYVRQKRALGFKYEGGIWILRSFDNFAKDFDIQNFSLTKELAQAWSEKRSHESNSYHASRIYEMRHFAEFLVRQGCDSFAPRFKLRNRTSTHTPYIFTTEEMGRIFKQLDRMKPTPCSPVKHFSHPLLYRVLYGCGLRISEALNLLVGDVDVKKAIIRIRQGKNEKERLVPMSESLTRRCADYMETVHAKHNSSHQFFYSRDGKPYCISTFEKDFKGLLWDADIPYCGKSLGPRLHDIRHTFVCHRLNQWTRDGTDLMVMLPVLSKYLGHETVVGTQWYLKLTAEAFPDITEKMNELSGYVFPEVGSDYLDTSEADGFCIYVV
jgi:integrase